MVGEITVGAYTYMIQSAYLDSDKKTEAYLSNAAARGITELAVDLEAEFNLHRYGEHLCLVQLFDGREYGIIDPFTVGTGVIKELFENEKITKIMYDCTGDRTLLYRSLDIGLKSVIDLLPAVEVLGLEKRGLGAVLNECLGLEQKPKKKFQRYNWMKRPVEPEALVYALEDVKYLFALRDVLMAEVEGKGLMDEYERKNHEVQNRPITLNPVPGVLKKRRFLNMPEKSRAIMRELHGVREVYAKSLNLPPDRVVSNEDLFKLALFQKETQELRFPRQVDGRRGEGIKKEFQAVFAMKSRSRSNDQK